ncbi:MAG TPA: glycosyltransferase family 1 protein [Burkholderiales bacterium]|nr:glycosyltransferase family 1 protein [Burkholderiales bacterium]
MVTETYPPEVNGVARTIGLMVDGLRNRGHSIQLVRPRQNGHDAAQSLPGFEEVLKRGIALPRYPQLKMGMPARGDLIRLWSEQRPQLVHVATEGPLGWTALAAAKSLGLPVATDFHTNFHAYSRHYGFSWLARPVAGYLRCFHNRADCTLVPTSELAEQLSDAGFERLRVVGRGVNPEVFSPARRSTELRASWGAGENTPVVLCVSRFAREKNFPLVIEAYEAMRRLRPDAKLVLVGDGPLAEQLRNRNIGYLIAGRLVNGELSAHYASGDIFLFPSTTETFGNVTLEAMASGLGVVAYRYAAAREHLQHMQSAVLAPFDDREAFIAGAVLLVENLPFARNLGRAARAAAESLTWERIVGDFEAALLDAAA